MPSWWTALSQASVHSGSRRGSTRQENSERVERLGMALRPAKKPRPWSRVSGVMREGRPMPHSLRASTERAAETGGMDWEPGRPQRWTRESKRSWARKGRKRNRPPKSVRKERGERSSASTEARGAGRGLIGVLGSGAGCGAGGGAGRRSAGRGRCGRRRRRGRRGGAGRGSGRRRGLGSGGRGCAGGACGGGAREGAAKRTGGAGGRRGAGGRGGRRRADCAASRGSSRSVAAASLEGELLDTEGAESFVLAVVGVGRGGGNGRRGDA